jgi:hypothetical protein
MGNLSEISNVDDAANIRVVQNAATVEAPPRLFHDNDLVRFERIQDSFNLKIGGIAGQRGTLGRKLNVDRRVVSAYQSPLSPPHAPSPWEPSGGTTSVQRADHRRSAGGLRAVCELTSPERRLQ